MSENLEGKTLNQRYEIQEKLGSGGFGTIYLARDLGTSIGGTYVVKHFSPSYDGEAQLNTGMRLFRQEADSLQKLGKHPQIPRIIDFFTEDNSFFLVQEWIEGQDFRQELAAAEPFNQKQVIELLTDILEVLKFIHESGYIHRDIKPSNLIRNRFNNRFFVIDFGAVKEKINPQNIATNGQYTKTVGILSPGYTPDEQLRGEPEFSSDIYALGMVAIEALVKVHPKNLARNLNQELIWRDFLQPHLDYPPDLLDLIDKMVEQNYYRRYQSAAEVLSALRLLNLPDPEPDPEPGPDNDENRFKIVAAGLGMIGVIALPLWFWLNNSLSDDFVTYENEQIRVDYPRHWQRKNSSNFLNKSVSFTSPRENETDLFQERVTVIVEESSQPLSLTEYTNQAVLQIENLSNFILSPPRTMKLGRSEGKYVIYQGQESNFQVKRYEVWTVNYQKIYSVVYTAEPEQYQKYLPTVEKMIQSLEILQ